MPGPSHPDDDMATPMIVHDSPSHIVIAVEITKSALRRHSRSLKPWLC
jgi:hypothetical protein